MSLGFLVQCIARGQVLSTSGLQRKIVNSAVYTTGAIQPLVADKALYWNGFQTAVWSQVVQALHQAYVGVSGDILFPNTPGDTQLSVGVPLNGTRIGARESINICAFIGISTGLRGRSFFGSKRLAPIASADVVGDELFVPGDLGWIRATGAWQLNFTINSPTQGVVNCTPVVWSRVLSALDPNVPPGIGGTVVACHLNRTLGTWRHRRERVVR